MFIFLWLLSSQDPPLDVGVGVGVGRFLLCFIYLSKKGKIALTRSYFMFCLLVFVCLFVWFGLVWFGLLGITIYNSPNHHRVHYFFV